MIPMCPTPRATSPAPLRVVSRAAWVWRRNPSRFSIACRAVGPVAYPANLPKKQQVFAASLSVFFKHLVIFRMLDADKKVVIYLAISSRLKEGSPFNSISVIPTTSP